MGDWLKTVYSETSSIKLNNHYKKWSSKYDQDMKEWGYAYPSQLKKIIQCIYNLIFVRFKNPMNILQR